MTEIFFMEALDRAKKLDEDFGIDKQAKGALFGLPISLKDQFQIKGTGRYKSCRQGRSGRADGSQNVIWV